MKNFLLHIISIRQRDLRRVPMAALVCLIMLSLLGGTNAQAQIITPLDGATTLDAQTGPYSRVRAECTDADSTRIYVIYQDKVEKYSPDLSKCTYTVAVWNGIIWNYLPSINLITYDGESSVKTMMFYKDELYVAGNFESVEGITNSTYIVKWDGNAWVSAANFTAKPKGYITALEIFNNNLIAAGHFEQVDGVFASNIAQFNGTYWNYVGVSGIKQGVEIDAEIFDIHAVNNSLYVGGNFASAGGDNTIRVLATWDGSVWTNPKIFLHECHLLGDYNGQIFAYGNVDLKPIIYKLEGSTWVDISSPKFRIKSSLTEFITYNGKLWASGSYIDQEDGNVFRSLLTYDGSDWTIVKTDNLGLEIPLYSYPHLTHTKSGLYISGAFTSNQGVSLKYVGKVETNMSVLQGTVFVDSYANCKRDNGEEGAAGRFVIAQPGNYLAVTDKHGKYLMKVPNGNYTVRILSKKYWHSACPDVKNGINVSVSDASIVNVIDIPTYGLDYMRDIEITLTGKSGWKMREGYTETYYVCAENVGTYNATNAEISVKVDDRLQSVNFGEDPIRFTDYTATWSIAVLKADEQKCFEFTAVAPIEVLNGEIVNFEATTNYNVSKDEDLDNNSALLSQKVTSAYDPNNKEVRDPRNPQQQFGETITINKGTDKLDYQINFQNTGNDTAYRVTVVDTVSVDHTYRYIKINKTSHGPPIYSFRLENNVFIWTFDGIMLPDSTTDQEGSKGFINFSISINSELAKDKEIYNKAYIYFDFQKPVETEKSRAKVGGVDDIPPVQLTDMIYVYPNPASNLVSLENQTNQEHIITITDVTGKVIDEVSVSGNQTLIINTSTYAQGVYFIRTGESAAYKLVIQR